MIGANEIHRHVPVATTEAEGRCWREWEKCPQIQSALTMRINERWGESSPFTRGLMQSVHWHGSPRVMQLGDSNRVLDTARLAQAREAVRQVLTHCPVSWRLPAAAGRRPG